MTTETDDTPVLHKYRVLYAVTRPEWFEIEAADGDAARENAFTEGNLVLIGDNTEVVDCDDVEIEAFSPPVVHCREGYSNVLTAPKK